MAIRDKQGEHERADSADLYDYYDKGGKIPSLEDRIEWLESDLRELQRQIDSVNGILNLENKKD